MKNNRLSRAQEAILAALSDQPDLIDIDALARHLGRHPNTLREHLAVLVRRGLVVRHQAPTTGRGRPRWLYGTADEPAVGDNAELAAALAWRLAHRSRDPRREAAAAGKEWARRLVGRMRLAPSRSPRSGRLQVVRVLEDLGYAPAPDRAVDKVTLRRCPMLQVAKEVPEMACAVHLAMIEELLEVSGADRTRTELVPFAAPGQCALRLLAPRVSSVKAPTGAPPSLRTAADPSR